MKNLPLLITAAFNAIILLLFIFDLSIYLRLEEDYIIGSALYGLLPYLVILNASLFFMFRTLRNIKGRKSEKKIIVYTILAAIIIIACQVPSWAMYSRGGGYGDFQILIEAGTIVIAGLAFAIISSVVCLFAKNIIIKDISLALWFATSLFLILLMPTIQGVMLLFPH